MFYIVRTFEAGRIREQEFDSLNEAREYMQTMTDHAELYVWIGGEEKFMESV